MAKYQIGQRAYAICYGQLCRVQVSEIKTIEHHVKSKNSIKYTVWYNERLSSIELPENELFERVIDFPQIDTSKFVR